MFGEKSGRLFGVNLGAPPKILRALKYAACRTTRLRIDQRLEESRVDSCLEYIKQNLPRTPPATPLSRRAAIDGRAAHCQTDSLFSAKQGGDGESPLTIGAVPTLCIAIDPGQRAHHIGNPNMLLQ